MTDRYKPLIFGCVMLILAALACSLGGKQEVPLGEAYQSDHGGFRLNKVEGYVFEDTYGIVSMIAPDVESNTGPYIIIIGGLLEEDTNPEGLLGELRKTAGDVEIGQTRTSKVDGIEGLMAELSGTFEGEAIKGKVFLAMPGPRQEFVMMGMAPDARWNELEPLYDAVLKSVTFFEAKPIEISEEEPEPIVDDVWEPTDDEPDTEESPEPTAEEEADISPYLGEVYQHPEAGYSMRKIKNYDFADDFGVVQMAKPGITSYAGPLIMIMSAPVDEPTTRETLFAEAKADPSEADTQFDSPVPYVLSGVQGLLVDFDGMLIGEAIKGQAFFAMLGADQYFIVRAIAPEAEWPEVQPLYEAMLASIAFSGEVAEPPVSEGQVIRQWAVRAEASSEYTPGDWSAMQATGAPNVNACGDDPQAWASRLPDTEEYLVLHYATPVNPTELVIYQTYNPTQVVEIQFIDTSGVTRRLWYGDPQELSHCPDVWTHTIALDEVFYTDTVVIFVDQSVLGLGWAEIDAVELVGYPMEN